MGELSSVWNFDSTVSYLFIHLLA